MAKRRGRSSVRTTARPSKSALKDQYPRSSAAPTEPQSQPPAAAILSAAEVARRLRYPTGPPPTLEQLSARAAELTARGKPPPTPEQLNARHKAYWGKRSAKVNRQLEINPEDVLFAVDRYKEEWAKRVHIGKIDQLEKHILDLAGRDKGILTGRGGLPKKPALRVAFNNLVFECLADLSKDTPEPSAPAVWAEMIRRIDNGSAPPGFELPQAAEGVTLSKAEAEKEKASRITFRDEKGRTYSIARSSFPIIFSRLRKNR